MLSLPDLQGVARVHRAAFPRSAISRLGHEAARRYYEWQLTGPHECHAIGMFDSDRLIGFCIGGTFNGARSGYVRSNLAFLVCMVLLHPWLLSDPMFRVRLRTGLKVLKSFLARSDTTPAHIRSSGHKSDSYSVLSIAVHPDSQNMKVGLALIREAESEARRKGHIRMTLTVNPQNHQAIRFYEKVGWQRVFVDDRWEGKMANTLRT